MKLELKHLAGYLPYGLKIRNFRKEETIFIEDILINGEVLDYILTECNLVYHFYKPILRQLSDLTKEIEVNGEKFVPLEEINKIHTLEYIEGLFNDEFTSLFSIEWLPYEVIQKLYEWHFDLYSLIEKGLAIDINTLNK